MKTWTREKKNYYAPVFVSVVICIVLFLIPTGYEGAIIYQGTDRCTAKVISVNNDRIIDTGLIRSGEQLCEIKLLGGKFEGTIVEGINTLNGSLENDKIFEPGDKALVVIDYDGDEVLFVNMIDHYRMNKEIILAVAFVLFLVLFAKDTGVRAVLSFLITILSIWKVLVPLYLKGINPIFAGLLLTIFLTALIISLVYGFHKKFVAATLGAIMGI